MRAAILLVCLPGCFLATTTGVDVPVRTQARDADPTAHATFTYGLYTANERDLGALELGVSVASSRAVATTAGLRYEHALDNTHLRTRGFGRVMFGGGSSGLLTSVAFGLARTHTGASHHEMPSVRTIDLALTYSFLDDGDHHGTDFFGLALGVAAGADLQARFERLIGR